MDDKLYKKIAEEISNQLISLWKNKQTNDLTIMELYNQLLDEKYYDVRYSILTYIPGILSNKGYEIVNSNKFDLRKY